jgi:hypothetical protein
MARYNNSPAGKEGRGMRLLHTKTKTMATHYLINAEGKIDGIMTVANIYQFKGFTFESHAYLGPQRLKKNFDPASRMGRKFFQVYDEWNKLTPQEKLKTQINA